MDRLITGSVRQNKACNVEGGQPTGQAIVARSIVVLGLVSSLLLSACETSRDTQDSASGSTPKAVSAAPPSKPAARPAAAATGSTASVTPTSQSVAFQIEVPLASQAVSAASYVSVATKSVRYSINGGTWHVAALGSGASGCVVSSATVTCTAVASVASAASYSLSAQGYASADGSGTPLESTVTTVSPGSTASPVWSPVVAAVQTAIDGTLAAGVSSSVGVTLVAKDAAGQVIPGAAANPVDATGTQIALTLSNSDTSGMTQLASTAYAGQSVALQYNGDLPLPNPITVTASVQNAKSAIPVTPASVTQPTASKSFTFTFGTQTVMVQNNTSIPGKGNNLDYWNAIPDSKIAIVRQGEKFLISWGSNAWSVVSNSPFPEAATGTSQVAYNPATPQNFEKAGWWFRDVMAVSHPFHPTNTNELVSFYHAESDYTGIHTKTVGVSYSHDGGKTWTPGAQILSPNGWASGQGVSAGDEGATYDPVNKRWVIFFTAIDPSPNQSGHLSQAVSNDPLGAPGTWHKLYNGSFTQPGLEGQETVLPAVQNQGYISAPTVSWNSYLNEWVMIADWGDVGEALMVSTDLYNWSAPIKLMDGKNLGYAGGSSAYPTLVGDHDDKITGQTSHLYFAEFSNSDPRIYGRAMLEQDLTFHRND